MANSFRKWGVYVDTAGAGAVIPDGTDVRIRKIRWVAVAGQAAHRAVVQDSAGNPFWEGVCTGANYAESEDFVLGDKKFYTLNGLKVPTLGSGVLYIYY
ncbi:MAG: hypothetical protein CV089_02215 [Nitrospira sp. WS110]|nr:hypothetical protein [Nitrospira sp. WS110]